jgi:hypothetical protein
LRFSSFSIGKGAFDTGVALWYYFQMKQAARTVCFVMTFVAVFFMTAHIFQHLVPGFSEPLGKCQICSTFSSSSLPALDLGTPDIACTYAPVVCETALVSSAIVFAQQNRSPPLV